jgi:glycosyl transferase, family 25
MHAFYINLDARPDRRVQIEEELRRLNISAERFSAIQRTPGTLGCTQSHLEVLKLARRRGYPAVMIFEDDFEFLVTPDEVQDVLSKLPDEYDVVMLSYKLQQQEPYNETFGRVLEVETASGYIVHSRFYDRLIDTLQEGLALFEQHPHAHWLYINDQYWKRLQPNSVWLYSLKRIGKQRASYSDLGLHHVDYGY